MRTLYIYYVDNPDFSVFDYEAIINDLLGDYAEGGAAFGYVNNECHEYGDNVSFGMVELSEDADIDEVIEMLEEEFLSDGIDLVDITYD